MSNSIFWDKLRILVTNSCNYNCHFCHNEGQPSRETIRTMDIKQFKILIDALKDEDLSEITFSGGEPFLDKDLIDMLVYASEETDWEVSCASNLSMITPEQVRKLKDISLKFNIQFPFTDSQRFRQSTGSGNLDQIKANIQMVREAGLKIGLNCVIQSNSEQDVRSMIEFALQEELPLKLLPQIGLVGSEDFKSFVFPILAKYAINHKEKGTGAIRWILESNGHQTSVLYIDSPCFTHDIVRCRNYSEIRILPDMSLQPCILDHSQLIKLNLLQGKEEIKQKFREAWKNLKNC